MVSAAVLILIGILIIAFGFFGNVVSLVQTGLIFTAAGVAIELFYTVIGNHQIVHRKHHFH